VEDDRSGFPSSPPPSSSSSSLVREGMLLQVQVRYIVVSFIVFSLHQFYQTIRVYIDCWLLNSHHGHIIKYISSNSNVFIFVF
jgi:hypothetical protein